MQRVFHHLFLGLCIAAVLVLCLLAGFFERWNWRITDVLFLPKPTHPDIAVVAIDDTSIRKIGQWPWKRSVYATLLKNLDKYPAVVGIDVAFSEESNPDEDAVLANQFARSNNIVLPIEGMDLSTTREGVVLQKIVPPIPLFTTLVETGLVNVMIDGDHVVRQIPVKVEGRGYESLQSFSFKVADVYAQTKLHQGVQINSSSLDGGLLRINYVGKPGTYPHYSFVDVLHGRIDPKVFDGKIVLLGVTALDLHDEALTPVSSQAMSGIEIQANAIQTILDKKYLIKESLHSTIATIGILSLLISLLFVASSLRFAALGTLILLMLWGGFAFRSFDQGVIRNMMFPPFTIIVLFITQVVSKYLQESKQKRFIRKAFSYYLSESVLSEVLKNPKKLSLGGERREMTVLFSDIAGFTTISEQLEPEVLAGLLNRYLTGMTAIVFSHKGVLDKYIGDAVMAFWGSPIKEKDHALLACKAALAMQEEMKHIKTEWKNYGVSDFSIRIGINTGEMIVGNMGSNVRFDYTLLGDNVNLGSRLEGTNKEYGTNILISGNTYEQVKNHVIARHIDTVAVKGKEKGIDVYELRGLKTVSREEEKLLKEFEKARTVYKEGKFKQARKAFQALHKEYPEDVPTRIFIARCEEYMKKKPSSWDGVYRSHSK